MSPLWRGLFSDADESETSDHDESKDNAVSRLYALGPVSGS